MTTLDDTNTGINPETNTGTNPEINTGTNTRTTQSTTSTVTEELRASARDTSATVKQHVNETRSSATERLESLAHAARVAASDLQQHDQDALSHYVAEMATSVTSLAEGLRKKSVDELIHDAKHIARNNPTLFIAGSIAIGLGIARFAKATQRRPENKTDINDDLNTSGQLKSEDNFEDSFQHSFQENFQENQRDNHDDIPTLHTGFSTQVERGQQNSRPGNLTQPGGNGADTMGGTRYE